MVVRGGIEPTTQMFSILRLLEHVKADVLEIGRANAEAIAFLLPDLSHAEVFGIGIQYRKAMRLLSRQTVETGRSSSGALRLAARGVLRQRDCRGERSRQQN